jgi:tRNA(His) 5'-end guanylyltransferase
MIDTTLFLVEETNARVGATQSDEISLVLLADFGQQLWFDRRIAKMNSVLAAMASVFFNKHLPSRIPEKINQSPVFDCRVFNVPDQTEAVNYLIWREKDATRNSVSMAAQSYFSHRKLQGKSRSEMMDMLFSKDINWNNYPTHFKRGTYVQRQKVERPFTTQELALLPPKHNAHKDPNLKVVRTDHVILELPPLTQVKNREAVIFNGDKPNGNEED